MILRIYKAEMETWDAGMGNWAGRLNYSSRRASNMMAGHQFPQMKMEWLNLKVQMMVQNSQLITLRRIKRRLWLKGLIINGDALKCTTRDKLMRVHEEGLHEG